MIRESIETPFRQQFAGKFEDKIDVKYVYQEVDSPIKGLDEIPSREKPCGTAHAVLMAQGYP